MLPSESFDMFSIAGQKKESKQNYIYACLEGKSAYLLWNWNIGAGILHLASFIAILALTIVNESTLFQSILTTDFTKTTTSSSPAPTLELIGGYSPAWIILPFQGITAMFHFVVCIPGVYEYYIYQSLGRGVLLFTWIEYCITPALMTWAVWALSGGTNVIQIILLTLLNVNMVLLGAFHEYLHKSDVPPGGSVDLKTYELLYRANKQKATQLKKDGTLHPMVDYRARLPIEWYNVILSFVNFAIIWLVIFWYFFTALGSADLVGRSVPWYVWTINIGIFFQYLLFGLHLVFHFRAREEVQTKPNPSAFAKFYSSRITYILGYIIQSITSKFFLNWVIWIGTLTARN